MLRVVMRDVNEPESVLLGDFPPSEVRALLELLDEHDLYVPDLDAGDAKVTGTQFVMVGGPSSRRWVLEVLLEDPA